MQKLDPSGSKIHRSVNFGYRFWFLKRNKNLSTRLSRFPVKIWIAFCRIRNLKKFLILRKHDKKLSCLRQNLVQLLGESLNKFCGVQVWRNLDSIGFLSKLLVESLDKTPSESKIRKEFCSQRQNWTRFVQFWLKIQINLRIYLDFD